MSLGGKAAGDISRMWPSRVSVATSRGSSGISIGTRDVMREGAPGHRADPKPGDWERFLRITGQAPSMRAPRSTSPTPTVASNPKRPPVTHTPIKRPGASDPGIIERNADMSMLRDFGQSLLGIATTRIAQRAGVLPGAGPTAQPQAAGILPGALPGLGPLITGAGRVATSPAGRRAAGTVIATAAGVGAGNVLTGGSVSGDGCPSGYHLDKETRSRCVRNRRMNYGNATAARRAIRRIKGTRRLLQSIERQLPKRTVRTRARTGAHKH